jgi:hypothetical protein
LVIWLPPHYNHVRLHSAPGYVTPADKLNGLEHSSSTSETKNAKRHVNAAGWRASELGRLPNARHRAKIVIDLGGG